MPAARVSASPGRSLWPTPLPDRSDPLTSLRGVAPPKNRTSTVVLERTDGRGVASEWPMLPARRPRIRRIPVTPPRTPARVLPEVTPPPRREREEESGIRLRVQSEHDVQIADIEV